MSILADGLLQTVRLATGNIVQFGATATTATGAMLTKGIYYLNTTAAVCISQTTTAATTDWRLSADQSIFLKFATADTLNVKAADSAATGVIGTLHYAAVVG